MKVEFFVAGKPQGKARPRVTARGTYTPTKTKLYENAVAWEYAISARKQKMTGYISAEIVAIYPLPARATKAQRDGMRSGKILPDVKPDLDNVVKIILDGLNGVAFDDDKQIVELYAKKRYGEKPGVIVRLSNERSGKNAEQNY